MAENNVVRKSLATMQDFAAGVGSVTQVRAGKTFQLNKISLAFAVPSEQELQLLDSRETHRASVVSGNQVKEYLEVNGVWTPVDFANSELPYFNRKLSFLRGNTLNSTTDALLNEADGSYYVWLGVLPKTVASNSTPASSGGVGPGAWMSVGKATYSDRQQLKDAADFIKYHNISVQKAMDVHGVTTSSLGIGTNSLDARIDTTDALRSALQTYSNIIIDTVCGITSPIQLTLTGQNVFGRASGRVFPLVNTTPSAAGNQPMLQTKAPYITIQGVTFDNPSLFKSSTGGRQGAIDLQSDYCTVQGNTFINQLNAVTATTTYAAHGSKVIGNLFIDCLGVEAEDRGDAVTLWGSGSIIAFNYATCKDGEDARLGFHCEAPIGGSPNPRPELDAKYNIIHGNYVKGTFRRHYTMEGIRYGVCTDNVSAGGATWWCEAYTQCQSVYVKNTLRYTRDASMNQGATWAPRRSCIAFLNYNTNVVVESVAIMEPNSVGAGLSIQTQNRDQIIEFKGSIYNQGVADNSAAFLFKPSLMRMTGASFSGFGTGVQLVIGAPANPAVESQTTCFTMTDSTISCTGSCVFNSSGTGAQIVLDGNDLSTTGTQPINLANYDKLAVLNNRLTGTTYAMSVGSSVATSIERIDGNVNMSAINLPIRISSNLTPVMGTNSNTVVGNNPGISFDGVWASAALSNVGSILNTVLKSSGLIVAVSGVPRQCYIATGSANNSVWRCITGGADITPTTPPPPTP